MNNKTPLPDGIIQSPKCITVITVSLLKERGLTPSHPLYTEAENLHTYKSGHNLLVEWVDKTTAIFSSTKPLSLNQLFPAQLAEAYRNSFYNNNRYYDMG